MLRKSSEPRAGQMVETPWGVKMPLHKIGNGSLAIKVGLPCAVCESCDYEAYLQQGCGGAYSYVVDFKTGKYIANIRDQVYVCPKPACQKAYGKRRKK